ncbi:MAG TPA: oligogalacturonate lyase family protein [Opitutaceae bacterium]|nr:oligogalacturonate lyase family protein [Opitutaceae bacterium]
MHLARFSLSVFAFAVSRAFAADAAPAAGPKEWIDPDTGHRIVRLTDEPGSASLYFHQNPFTPKGDKMIISTPEGLSTIDLRTHAIELVAPEVRYSMGSSAGIEVGRKTPTVYYQKNIDGHTVLYATNVETKATREIIRLPFTGEFGGVSADETMIIGKTGVPGTGAPGGGRGPQAQGNAPTAGAPAADGAQGQGRRGGGGGAAGGPRRQLEFFTVNIATGELKTFYPTTDNLNHIQSSPTDPNMVLFCHEGEWHEVDRIWTMHDDGSAMRLMHKRTMQYEIAGHEFFSHDGQQVWYDLQTPRSVEFWLAAVNLYNGERIRYPITREQWSVHYNVSWNGKLFSGDGGGPDGVANLTPLPEAKTLNPPVNNKWIYLFTPVAGKMDTIKVDGENVKVGKFTTEKLVNMAAHDYSKRTGVEPNLIFTPDDKWLVFRSKMQGNALQVYAVEIAKAKKS